MGTHSFHKYRYPEAFSKWKPDESEDSESLNNAYDNSVLYTDFIISEIIKIAEKEKAIVFYTSDHGESLGDNGRWWHGYAREQAIEQYQVPFFVYISPKFANTKNGKQVLSSLKKQLGRKDISHDNVFHTILGCTGFKNIKGEEELIDKSLNLCN